MSVIRLQFVIQLRNGGEHVGSAFAWAAREKNSNIAMLTHDPLHENCMRYGDEETALADMFSFYATGLDFQSVECVCLGDAQ